MSDIKAIFCDVNGVLFEQEERFSDKYSQEFGVPLEKLSPFFSSDMDLCLTGKADLKVCLEKLLTEWEWKGTVAELLDYWFAKDIPKPYKNIINYLTQLRENKILLFLATQNEKYKTAKFLELLGPILKYDYVIPTYEIGYKKADSKYFTKALSKYNLKPQEVVLIDNNPKAITAAQSIGMPAIFFIDEQQTISDLQRLLN